MNHMQLDTTSSACSISVTTKRQQRASSGSAARSIHSSITAVSSLAREREYEEMALDLAALAPRTLAKLTPRVSVSALMTTHCHVLQPISGSTSATDSLEFAPRHLWKRPPMRATRLLASALGYAPQ